MTAQYAHGVAAGTQPAGGAAGQSQPRLGGGESVPGGEAAPHRAVAAHRLQRVAPRGAGKQLHENLRTFPSVSRTFSGLR